VSVFMSLDHIASGWWAVCKFSLFRIFKLSVLWYTVQVGQQLMLVIHIQQGRSQSLMFWPCCMCYAVALW